MIENLRLYWKLIGVSVRSQMQHRSSFLILSATLFLSTFVEIFGIWVLFDRFHMVQGWTLPELALIYAIIHMGFALGEAFTRGFDTFSTLVVTGDFDRILLRPCSTLLQVAARELQLMRVGRFLQAFVILNWSCAVLHLSLFSPTGWLVLFAVIGTACLFGGLFVIQATLAFWTTETLELMNIATYGGVEAGQYPITIYPTWFQYIFSFLIPLACVGYYPIAILLKHEQFPLWAGFLFPLFGCLFLLVACQLWHFGVRHYHSTGS